LGCYGRFVADWEAIAAQVKAGIAADVEAAQERARTATRVREEVEGRLAPEVEDAGRPAKVWSPLVIRPGGVR